MTITNEEARERFRAYIKEKFRTQAAAAARFGVSGSFVHKVLTGKTPMTKAMADKVGLERFHGWKEKE